MDGKRHLEILLRVMKVHKAARDAFDNMSEVAVLSVFGHPNKFLVYPKTVRS